MTDEPTEVATNPEIVAVEHPEPRIIGSDVEPEAEPEQPAEGQTSIADAIANRVEQKTEDSEAKPEPEAE